MKTGFCNGELSAIAILARWMNKVYLRLRQIYNVINLDIDLKWNIKFLVTQKQKWKDEIFLLTWLNLF
ncbi:MAG: hypothetical protein HEQ19_31440 [Gloeotrichia echinulata CP02]